MIRPATDLDNAALCDLARRCPQGEHLRFYHERRDYRERGRLHDDGEVFVAECEGRLAGSASVARKHLWLNGAPCPTAYVYDVLVDPAHRGRGLARQLVGAVRGACSAAEVFYCYVLADNAASQRLFAAAGFTPHPRRLLYHTLLPRLARRRPPPGYCVLPPSSRAAACDAWLPARYEFLDSTAGHDALFYLEGRGGRAWAALRRHGPKVFVGVPWYYDALGRLLPFVPRAGRPVRVWSLHHLGADGPRPRSALGRLLASVAWSAAEEDIDAVTLPLYENDPHAAVVRRHTLTGWGVAPAVTLLFVSGPRSGEVLGAVRPLLSGGRDG